jgi:hypothetical protein
MEVVEKETSGAIGEVTDPVCRNLKENVHSSSSVSVKDEEKTPTRLNRFCADFAPRLENQGPSSPMYSVHTIKREC